MKTSGNDQCHLILRGGREPNYRPEDIRAALADLIAAELPPFVMVDCSHGNSRKEPANQPLVCDSIASQIADGQRGIAGAMIESHLVAGSQPVAPREQLAYGQSITDACVDWETTVEMLEALALAVRERRLNR